MKPAPKFPTNFVLIDFENVQPDNLALLRENHFQVFVLVGSHQSKLDMEFVGDMQALGTARAKFIHVKESGKNALDFCLTFYVGALVAKYPKAYFHIISKDKGFDPFVAHLQGRNIKASRHDCISHIPIVTGGVLDKRDEVLQAAVNNLKARGQAKPRTQDALINVLKHSIKNKMNDQEAAKLLQSLIQKKHIAVKAGIVTYKLTG